MSEIEQGRALLENALGIAWPRTPELDAAAYLIATGLMPEGWTWNDGSAGEYGAMMRSGAPEGGAK